MMSLKYIIALFCGATGFSVNGYYNRIRKTRRIVYNIEYMRSKKGIVLVILFTLLSFGQIFVWPLILR